MAVALFVWFLEFEHAGQCWEQHICRYVNQVSPLKVYDIHRKPFGSDLNSIFTVTGFFTVYP